MTEIPAHLLKRSQAARDQAGASGERGEQVNIDPFERRKTSESQRVGSLQAAKATLVAALGPIRQHLDGEATTLSGQFIRADALRTSAAFTPINSRDSDTPISLTLFGKREAHAGVENGKSIRIGEEHAWRVLIHKGEIGTFLKGAGKRPVRDTIKLSRGNALFAQGSDLDPKIIERVFDGAVAERVTNSVVLYEGDPGAEAHSESYGNRYGISASIVRNPASITEQEGIFGVDFLTFDGQLRVDERPMEDGAKMDNERVALAYRREYSPEETVIDGLMHQAAAMRAFADLLTTPNQSLMLEACGTIDHALSRK